MTKKASAAKKTAKPARAPAAKAKAKAKAKARPAVTARKSARPARPAKAAVNTRRARPAGKARLLPDEPPPAKSYMTMRQLDWFRRKLEDMLNEIKAEAEKIAKDLREQEKGLADEVDRAHSELAFVVDLRENERISNLQLKINHVLRLIDNGVYGFCDECGMKIGMQRMTARPVATKCIDCKQFQEKLERSV